MQHNRICRGSAWVLFSGTQEGKNRDAKRICGYHGHASKGRDQVTESEE
jgi:hypothetical protein